MRFLFLKALYEVAKGDFDNFVSDADVITKIKQVQQGVTDAEIESAISHLVRQGLIKYSASRRVRFEQAGVEEIERKLANPEKPTTEFPATINVAYISSISHSNFQQGTVHSHQNIGLAGNAPLPQEPVVQKSAERQQPEVQKSTEQQLILLIHGIRTQAEWQPMVMAELSGEAAIVVPLKYGYFNAFQFWCPLFTRRPVLNQILWRIRDACASNPNRTLVIIAHSFGSYAVVNLLRKNGDIRCKRLLLCGGVINRNHRWDLMPNRPAEVLNECGSLDIWPILAEALSWGYGASGVFGFGSPGVRDRFHYIHHSDYLRKDFVVRYWKPWIKNGTIIESDYETKRPPMPMWRSVLATLPLQWLITAILFCVVLWGVFGYSQLIHIAQIPPRFFDDHTSFVDEPIPPELLPNPEARSDFPSPGMIAQSSQRPLEGVVLLYRNKSNRNARLLLYDCAMHQRGQASGEFHRSYFRDWPLPATKNSSDDAFERFSKFPKDSNWFGVYVFDVGKQIVTLVAFLDLTTKKEWRLTVSEVNGRLVGKVDGHD